MASWHDVVRRLETELLTLGDEEFVVLGEPEPATAPARGLLRRRPRPAPTRYVQVRRSGGHWYAECVGATSFGGDWEVDPATDVRLRALGWLVPGDDDPSGVQPSYPNYWRVLPREDARDAVVLPYGEAHDLSLEGVRHAFGPLPRIGTSSVRRIAQLLNLLPGARFLPIRGNLDTRLRKLDAGEFDAIVLAAAGLRRLGHAERISAMLPVDACVPAPPRPGVIPRSLVSG